jgi:hypothetical protein
VEASISAPHARKYDSALSLNQVFLEVPFSIMDDRLEFRKSKFSSNLENNGNYKFRKLVFSQKINYKPDFRLYWNLLWN